MLVATHLPVAEVEQTHSQLLLQLPAHLLLSQLVVKLVGQGLSCIQPLLWRVDHHLTQEVQ